MILAGAESMSLHRIVLIVIVLCVSVSVSAETIYLKNGLKIPGQIVGQDRESIRIKTLNGGVRRILKSQVRRVTYEPVAETRRREEAAQKRAEEAARRKEEEEQRKKEEEAARRAEEEAKEAEEAAKNEENQEKRAEEEAARKEEEEREQREAAYESGEPYRMEALLRSLILPGWGQYYQGRSGAAFGIGGAFFASAAGMSYYDRIYASRRNDYETSANQFFLTSPLFLSSAGFSISSPLQLAPLGFGIAQNTSAARVRMEDAARWSNNFRTLLVGLYVWNLADVLIFHPSADQEVGVSVRPGGAGMRYSFYF